MKTRAKILIALLGVACAVGAFAYAQERRQQALLDAVRGSISIGDSREKLDRVIRQNAFPLTTDSGGRSYTAHIWFHFRRDVAVTVILNEHGQVDSVAVKDLVE